MGISVSIQLNPIKFEELLDKEGWSCHDVSRKIEENGGKCSVPTVTRGANGIPISRKKAKLIADVFGVTVAYLKADKALKVAVRKSKKRANPSVKSYQSQTKGDKSGLNK